MSKIKFERSGKNYKKEDDGAYITYRDSGLGFEKILNIKFGYHSSGKEYQRDLNISFDEMVKLRNFLNEKIQYEAKKQKSYKFFTYGSNILFERIKDKFISVEKVTPKRIDGYKIVFNKLSKSDNSAKANIINTGNSSDSVWGVVYRINWHDKPKLSEYEETGKGYNENWFYDLDLNTKIYIASESQNITDKKPFNWYLKLIIAGAQENDFPESYIDYLRSIDTIEDVDECRRLENLKILGDPYKMEHYNKCT